MVMIDTFNEDNDTYRFKKDCEKWYGLPIETITAIGTKHDSIQAVWYKFKTLNTAHGAICSSELKRDVRKRWQKGVTFKNQVFGFDIDEPKRAKAMTLNYPKTKSIYPLLMYGLSKKKCIEIITNHNIEMPNAYQMGYHNNNCLGSQFGCIQGGIGYWQKIQRENIEAFNLRARIEHELTDSKGKPVTMLKDQSKEAKKSGNFQVFLLPHPDYPQYKSLKDMKGREPEPLFDCNGFGCAVNDLTPNETINELNN